MKTSIRILSLVVLAAAVLGLPRVASAAKVFASMSALPISTNVTPGVAANVSTTISVVNGNAGSSVTAGTACAFSVSVAPAEPTLTAAMSVTNFSAVKPGTQTTLLTVQTTSLTPANTYVFTVWANSNPSNSATITPISTTYTLTVAASGPFNPVMLWSPAGVNTNWSTAGNWSPNGPPVSSNDVDFFDLGAVGSAGAVDNYVDSSLTIGSLNYGQTNGFHTTLIAPGQTLSLIDSNGLAAGTGTDDGPSQTTVNTITGATGTLIVNNSAATVSVTQPNLGTGSANATLDMSGLGAFKASIARLAVGVDLVVKGDNGSLFLAGTNVISMTPGSSAPQIDIGDNSQANGTSGNLADILQLGQTNAFYADSIEVGRGRVTVGGSMLFNSTAIAPTAYFRGTNGNSSRVGTWYIGDANTGKNGSCRGTNDFSLGTVDALVNSMFIGVGSSAATGPTPGTGVLLLNAGSINASNLVVGMNAVGTGAGIVTVTGGTLTANNSLSLATGGATASANVSVSSAALNANNGIIVGPGTATLSLTSSTLNVTNPTATIGSTTTPLSSLSVSGSTLNLVTVNSSPTISTVNLTAGGGPNTINIRSVALLTGFPTQFPIIQYGLNGGAASGDLTTFVLGSLPAATPPYGAYISNNVANNSIDIVFTNGPFVPALVWDGTPTGAWNISSTANWRPKSGPDTTYSDGAFVTFDDTLTGTPNINLTTTVSPGSVTASNTSAAYVLGGTGKISGTTGLFKGNPGTFIIDNSGVNDFSGGVNISDGTLQIGNNDANGSLPAGPLVDNGTLTYAQTTSTTLSSIISGAGTLNQNGTGILTLTATNTAFTGVIQVMQGTLQTGNTNALGGTASVTVSSGATLDVDGQSLFGAGFTAPVNIAGAGVGGNGALINSGASQTKVLHALTMTANSTIGGAGDIEIRNSSGNSAPADGHLNGAFNLTKTGTNNVSLRGVTIDSGLQNINVQAGSMSVVGTATATIGSLGNPSATITVFTNATLTLDTIGNVPSKNFALSNGGTLKSSSTNTLSSPLTLTGPGQNAITVNSGSQFFITTPISGSGGFIKNGNSVLFLNAANTYTGSTTISGGTLALYSGGLDGSIASSTNINISSGGTLDVSGRSDGTLTLVSGQTLNCGGGGTNAGAVLNGILVASPGSVVGPGTTNSAGTLSVISNAVLQGTTVMEVSGTNGNDQINAAAVTYGGTLVVGTFLSAVTNGQTFQLFVSSNGVYNAGTFGSVTLPSAVGLSWTNNLAVNGTITAGVVTGPKPMPVITHISLTGTSLHINGTNGQSSATFNVFASTNLALPLNLWTSLSTNSFSGDGTFNITNTVDGSAPQSFFLIKY